MLCGLYGGDAEGDEGEDFGSSGAHGGVEGDALCESVETKGDKVGGQRRTWSSQTARYW